MAVRITAKTSPQASFARKRRGAGWESGAGCWRLPWFWMGLTARRRQKTAAWIGRRCGIGPTVTMRRACRACSTVARRIHPCLLSAAQKEELAEMVRAGPDPETDGVVRWRRIDLKRKIEERFGVTMHERTVGKQLASLGFRRLSARPQHPKSDPDAQEAFKKTSPQR